MFECETQKWQSILTPTSYPTVFRWWCTNGSRLHSTLRPYIWKKKKTATPVTSLTCCHGGGDSEWRTATWVGACGLHEVGSVERCEKCSQLVCPSLNSTSLLMEVLDSIWDRDVILFKSCSVRLVSSNHFKTEKSSVFFLPGFKSRVELQGLAREGHMTFSVTSLCISPGDLANQKCRVAGCNIKTTSWKMLK